MIELIILALFIALQLGDFYTTCRVLRAGGIELNPLLVFLFGRIGVIPALVLYKGGCIAIGIWMYAHSQVEVMVLLSALYSWVVYHNFKQMKGGR